MFQFPELPSISYVLAYGYLSITSGEFPHSDICGYNGYLLLTAAFRSLSRPSSAPSAKASALCSFLLNQLIACISVNAGLYYCLSLEALTQFVKQIAVGLMRDFPKSLIWLKITAFSVKILLVFLFNNSTSEIDALISFSDTCLSSSLSSCFSLSLILYSVFKVLI